MLLIIDSVLEQDLADLGFELIESTLEEEHERGQYRHWIGKGGSGEIGTRGAHRESDRGSEGASVQTYRI